MTDIDGQQATESPYHEVLYFGLIEGTLHRVSRRVVLFRIGGLDAPRLEHTKG